MPKALKTLSILTCSTIILASEYKIKYEKNTMPSPLNEIASVDKSCEVAVLCLAMTLRITKNKIKKMQTSKILSYKKVGWKYRKSEKEKLFDLFFAIQVRQSGII